MSDPSEGTPPHDLSRLDLMAAAGSLVWIVAVAGYAWLTRGEEGASLLATLASLVVPLILVWGAVFGLHAIWALRAEAADLRAAVDAMRRAYEAAQSAPPRRTEPFPDAAPMRLDAEDEDHAADLQVASQPAVAVQPPAVPATFLSRRDTSLTVASADRKAAHAAPQPQPEVDEPGLALGTPVLPTRPALPLSDLVRALQFPENAEDHDGFRALRAALEDHRLAKLIRAAQDVLTLLSQEGIYMDDLKPEMARPDLWRRFAAGERGRSVAAIGGIRDRASLALTAGRMREDTVFRDAAHHFLRTFDRTFAEVEPLATDVEIAALADTRTARAFMLFGRVTGTFD